MYEQFSKVYQEDIMPHLNVIEEKRLSTQKGMFITGAIGATLAFIVFMIFRRQMNFFFPVAILGLTGVIANIQYNQFRSMYKFLIMPALLKGIDTSYVYDSKGKVLKELVWHSMLFRHGNRFNGEDLTRGTYHKTRFQFSEVKIENESGSGKDRHVDYIFGGVYYIFDFNKHFSSRTQVRTSGFPYNKWFDGIDYHRMELEDVSFMDDYKVYTDNEQESFYILSPSLMERIKKLEAHFESRNMFMSFVGDNLHLAFETSQNFFEPKLTKTVFDEYQIYKHYQMFRLVHDLIDELNLNTRIWTKN